MIIKNLTLYEKQFTKNQQNKRMKFLLKKKIILFTLIAIFVVATGCNHNIDRTISEESEWLVENDDEIDRELNKVINQMAIVDDSLWIEKSFVITDNDTTVLGAFAQRIKDINKCFEIKYTHYKNPQIQKKITIIRDLSDECHLASKRSFEFIDSTKHFKISFDTLR